MAFTDTFRDAVFAAGTSAMLLIASPVEARNNETCLPLQTTQYGQVVNSGTSALNYSFNNRKNGTIAISAFPGPDLHNTPEQLTNYFRGNKDPADCFINNAVYSNRGTVITMYVAGIPVEYNGKTSFGIQELRDNPQILQAARDESLMARVSFANLDDDRSKPDPTLVAATNGPE